MLNKYGRNDWGICLIICGAACAFILMELLWSPVCLLLPLWTFILSLCWWFHFSHLSLKYCWFLGFGPRPLLPPHHSAPSPRLSYPFPFFNFPLQAGDAWAIDPNLNLAFDSFFPSLPVSLPCFLSSFCLFILSSFFPQTHVKLWSYNQVPF